MPSTAWIATALFPAKLPVLNVSSKYSGPASPDYTLAGGSSAHGSSARGNQRAFLMNYNERTGAFGRPKYFTYGNASALFTHFDGITAVPGGFNLVAISSAQPASMAFIPVTGRRRSFGRATWYPNATQPKLIMLRV